MDPKSKQYPKKINSSVEPKNTVQDILDIAISQENQELQTKVGDLEEQLKQLQNKNIRLLADMDNLHKQQTIEVTQAKKSGKKSLATPIGDLITTINLSFGFVPKDSDQKFLQYVTTLQNSLAKAREELKGVGLELIMPLTGEEFDATTMQSLNASDEHIIKQVVGVGYKLDGQVINPAVVLL